MSARGVPTVAAGNAHGVASNRRVVPHPRSAVWAALADGHCYARWVVGTTTIRAVDDDWPAPGSRLHYSIGRGPVRHHGHTEVLSAEPGRRLELEAHAWPMGSVWIEMTLDGDGDRCTVTMVERPARGTLARLHNPVGDLLLKVRNVEALRRLERHVTDRGLVSD